MAFTTSTCYLVVIQCESFITGTFIQPICVVAYLRALISNGTFINIMAGPSILEIQRKQMFDNNHWTTLNSNDKKDYEYWSSKFGWAKFVNAWLRTILHHFLHILITLIWSIDPAFFCMLYHVKFSWYRIHTEVMSRIEWVSDYFTYDIAKILSTIKIFTPKILLASIHIIKYSRWTSCNYEAICKVWLSWQSYWKQMSQYFLTNWLVHVNLYHRSSVY